MPRKKAEQNGKLKPLIPFDPPIQKKKLTVEIDAPEAEKLAKYPAFVKETTGAAPSLDEVLVKALKYFFSRDHDFKTYLGQATNSGNRQPATGSGETGK
jgi:hypothetical protein